MANAPLTLRLSDIGRKDGDKVGGKNASLGEMIGSLREAGIRVPGGFATTATAYWQFIDANELREKMADHLAKLKDDRSNLDAVGKAIRKLIAGGDFPAPLAEAITRAYQDMAARLEREDPDVAVRSSATAEDLPEASFAGQLETFLNVRGNQQLLDAVRRCFASLFTDRAIAYRENHGFDHMKVALSVGVQRMVRADLAGSGVMFSIDTETGFPHSVLINAAWGLGETVVQGMVDPDEYQAFKPLLGDPSRRPIVVKSRGAKARKMVYASEGKSTSKLVDTSEAERFSFVLTDDELLQLGRWAAAIEAHYGQPMDMEWAKDGETGELFIVQARPETVQARKEAGTLKAYRLEGKGKKLCTGLAIGDAIAAGKVLKLESPDKIDRFEKDAVLVTGMTDPDWVPIMKKASAIVTDHGGRTSHAAIVSRELGLTAIVGAGDATEVLQDGQEVTVSCAEGDEGLVYEGRLEFEEQEIELGAVALWQAKVRHYRPLIERIIAQTERRVLAGEPVPASNKLVSLFEPHADIIRKGSAVAYGHKLNLTTGRSGLILDVVIEAGNPADSERLLPMLERHIARYGKPPRQAAADGSYASRDNLSRAQARAVRDMAFHKKGGLKIEDMVKSRWVYRKLRNFRAGIEAGISCLKRAYGLARCTWRGLDHFRAYVWSAVVAYNLALLARLKPA